MIDYAAQLADLRLFHELKNSAGRDGLTETDVADLVGMVNHAAAVAGPLLALIPQTFRQYTDHDVGHCRNLIYLMGRFIPEETLKRLNGLELAVLILSALLHDFGMFVGDEERAEVKRAFLGSQDYGAFTAGHHARAVAVEEARRAGEHERAEAIEDSLLADYFRRMHPQRARDNVRAHLRDRLVFRELDISEYVLDVCESHAWGVYESGDPLRPEKTVSQLPVSCPVHAFPLNLRYVACCLRLADIMDFDRSRTPVVVFQNINFTDAESWKEWNKHLAVGGWTINEREVSFRTECTHPSFYVSVMEFLDAVDEELSHCRRLVVKEAPAGVAERYRLHLPPVADRWDVEMKDKSYLAGGFRFQLEYERIMQLLMDKSLYPDPSLFLRELLQNALDACRNMEALAKEYDYKDYTPRIAVWDFSDDPQDPRVVFMDNGVGMSRKIVENYFMRVGRSYYRSPEFDAERARLKKKGIELEATSQFGIGILSCFMVADRFEVETRRTGDRPLHITIEGPTKYFTIKLLDPPPSTPFPVKPTSPHDDGPPRHPGTRLTVHLRPGVKLNVFQTLDTFAANVDYDITINDRGETSPKTVARHRWEAEQPWVELLEATINKVGSNAILREMKVDVKQTAQNLMTALVASRIPFEQYEFSKHLHGVSWFWLLQGADGRACFQRGHLKMGGSLEVTGPPHLVRQFTKRISSRHSFNSPKWSELISALRTTERGNKKLIPGTKEYAVVGKFVGYGLLDDDMSAVVKEWNDLSDVERASVCKSLESRTDNSIQWYQSPRAVESLLRGGDEWAEMSLSFNHILNMHAAPSLVSLHGILLPGGFVAWRPMEGSSNKIELMRVAGGAQLDMRGPNLPVPTASRLYVDASEAPRVLVPFARAALRHALELSINDAGGLGWRGWFDYMAITAITQTSWLQAAREEYALLESSIKYKLIRDGQIEYRTRQEVIDRYGQWAPLHHNYLEGDRPAEPEGLYASGATTLLLVFKNSRNSGGRREVDMNSFAPPVL